MIQKPGLGNSKIQRQKTERERKTVKHLSNGPQLRKLHIHVHIIDFLFYFIRRQFCCVPFLARSRSSRSFPLILVRHSDSAFVFLSMCHMCACARALVCVCERVLVC